MSKSLSKFSFEGEYNKLHDKVKTVTREIRVVSKLKQINTTGLSYPFSASSNVAIDKMIEGPCGELPTEELNGIMISDPTNGYIFVRQSGAWKRLKVE